MLINSHKRSEEFKNRVNQQRNELMKILWDLKSKGVRIVAIPAPAKGSTLLNFCRIGSDILDHALEKSDMKIGRHIPSTHIKILDESIIYKNQPDMLFCYHEI